MQQNPIHDPIEVLQGPFDPDVHAETFHNYLEVVIDPEGTVSYASPSHLKALERAWYEIYGKYDDPTDERNLDDLYARMPENANPLQWLMDRTGYICVWTDRIESANWDWSPKREYTGVNGAQAVALQNLANRGLYRGYVPITLEVFYQCDGDCIEDVFSANVDIRRYLDATPVDDLPELYNIESWDDFIERISECGALPVPLDRWPGPFDSRPSKSYEAYVIARANEAEDAERLTETRNDFERQRLRAKLRIVRDRLANAYDEQRRLEALRATLSRESDRITQAISALDEQ